MINENLCPLSSRRRVPPGLVGEKGKAIGVDATPEMVWRARETKAKYGDKYANAEFRLGEIEHLPVDSGSVDYVISNCVINLSPDKLAVFREAYRVLKAGGTFAVADVTLPKEIPESAERHGLLVVVHRGSAHRCGLHGQALDCGLQGHRN